MADQCAAHHQRQPVEKTQRQRRVARIHGAGERQENTGGCGNAEIARPAPPGRRLLGRISRNVSCGGRPLAYFVGGFA